MLARNCLLFQNGIIKPDNQNPENPHYEINFVKLNDFLQKLTTQNYNLQCDIDTRVTERIYKEELKLREELIKKVESMSMDINIIKDFIYCSGSTTTTTLKKINSSSVSASSNPTTSLDSYQGNGLMNTRDRIHMLHSEIELLKMALKRNEFELYEANDLNNRLKKLEKIVEKLIKRFETYSTTDWYEPIKNSIKKLSLKMVEDIDNNNKELDLKFNGMKENIDKVNNRIDGIKQSSISPILSRLETNEKKIQEIYQVFLGDEFESETTEEDDEDDEDDNEEEANENKKNEKIENVEIEKNGLTDKTLGKINEVNDENDNEIISSSSSTSVSPNKNKKNKKNKSNTVESTSSESAIIKRRSSSILLNNIKKSNNLLTERFIDVETFNKLKKDYETIHDDYNIKINNNSNSIKNILFNKIINKILYKNYINKIKKYFIKYKTNVKNLIINDQQLLVYRIENLESIHLKIFKKSIIRKRFLYWKNITKKLISKEKVFDSLKEILIKWLSISNLKITSKFSDSNSNSETESKSNSSKSINFIKSNSNIDNVLRINELKRSFNIWKIFSSKIDFYNLLKKNFISINDKHFQDLEDALILQDAYKQNTSYSLLKSIVKHQYKLIKNENEKEVELKNTLKETINEVNTNLNDFKSNLRAEEVIRARFLDDRFNNNITEINTIHKTLIKLNSYHDELKINLTSLINEKESQLNDLIHNNHNQYLQDIQLINSKLTSTNDLILFNQNDLINRINELISNHLINKKNIELNKVNHDNLSDYIHNILLKHVENNSSLIEKNIDNINKIFTNIKDIEHNIDANKSTYDRFVSNNDEIIHYLDEEIKWLKKVSNDGANSIIKLKNNINQFKCETEKNFLDIIYDEGGEINKNDEKNLSSNIPPSSINNSLTFSYYDDLSNLSNKLIKYNKHYAFIIKSLLKLYRNFLNYNLIKKLLISLPNSSTIFSTGKYNASNPYEILVYNKLTKCKELGNKLTINLGKLARRLSLRISSTVDQESLSLYFYIKLLLNSNELKLINNYNLELSSTTSSTSPSSMLLSNGINQFITKDNLPNVPELRKFFLSKIEEDLIRLIEIEGNNYKHVIPNNKDIEEKEKKDKEKEKKKKLKLKDISFNLSMENASEDDKEKVHDKMTPDELLKEKQREKIISVSNSPVSIKKNNEIQEDIELEDNFIDDLIKKFENEILNLYAQSDTVPLTLSSLIRSPSPTPIAPGSPSIKCFEIESNSAFVPISGEIGDKIREKDEKMKRAGSPTSFTQINNFNRPLTTKHQDFLSAFYSSSNIKNEEKLLQKKFIKNFFQAVEISLNSLPILTAFNGNTSSITSTNLISTSNNPYKDKNSTDPTTCITCNRSLPITSAPTIQHLPITSSTTFYKSDRPHSALTKTISNTTNNLSNDNEFDQFNDQNYSSKTVEQVRNQVQLHRPKSASYIINSNRDSPQTYLSNTQPLVSLDNTQAFTSPSFTSSSQYYISSNNASIPSNAFLTSTKLYSTTSNSVGPSKGHSIPPSVNVKNSSKFQNQLVNSLANPFPRDITFNNKHDEPVISPYESGLSSRRIKGINEKI